MSNEQQRVRIILGKYKGKEGELDGGSQLQHVVRVQLDGMHFSKPFPEHYVEMIPQPEATGLR